MDIFSLDTEAGGPVNLRLNPLKTSLVAFNVFQFGPWQALAMHRHPGCEEVFYVIGGRCLFYVDDEVEEVGASRAVRVPEGAMHAVLSLSSSTLLSVQGPKPVRSIYTKGLEYFCPACQLETPLPAGTRTGDATRCPRCRAALRLTEAGEAFDAVLDEPPRARA